MEIYIADVRVLADAQIFEEKCGLLLTERREQIQRLRKPEDKLRSAGAGLLLEYGLRQRGYTLCEDAEDKIPLHVAESRYGKPYFADAQELYFNLSHSGDYVAAIFAECEAGIDIERVRAAKTAVARRFFTEEEYRYMDNIRLEDKAGDEPDMAFAFLWTRKESYIKAVGEGMHLPLTDFCVLSDEVTAEVAYHLRTWMQPEGYALSVCTRSESEAELTGAELTYVDLAESI